jgi:PilZ domain-containing protein
MRNTTATDYCRSQRIPATVPIRLVVVSDDFSIEREASTVDLSLRGVKVRTPLALLAGDTVGVIPIGEFRHAIPARVVWTQRARTDQWSVAGLEFLETLPA